MTTQGSTAMPTRNVVLSHHQQDVIEALVQSGRYQNASEVLRDGLRLVEQREAEDGARLEALRNAAQTGWSDVDAGRFTDIADNDLPDFMGRLGRLAAERGSTSG
jgi:antitoxin ParD1/3/4